MRYLLDFLIATT